MHASSSPYPSGKSLAEAITFPPGDHRFAVLADTHVDDRVPELAPQLREVLQALQPEAIFLAGDLSKPIVVNELEQIARVYVVQGNQDWLRGYSLPKQLWFEVNGLYIVLTHGHVNMFLYTLNYLRLLFFGQKISYRKLEERLARRFPQANLIIYGHTHFQIFNQIGDQQFLNPGAAYPHNINGHRIDYALLEVSAEGRIQVELLHLAG